MTKNVFRKGLVVGIIVILICMSNTPLIENVQADEIGFEVAVGYLHKYGSYDFSARQIARATNGDLYVVYFRNDAGYNQIFMKKSIDNGENWVNEEKVQSESLDQENPVILIDSLDRIVVIWRYSYDTSLYCRIKSGGSWGDKEMIASSVSDGLYTQILDANDNIHVLYTVGYEGSCCYRKRTSAGWQPEELVSGGYWQRAESITVESNGIVHAFFNDASGTTYYNLMHCKRINGVWSTPTMIDQPNNELGSCSCAITTDDGNIHVTWVYKTGSTHKILYRKYVNNAWLPDIETIASDSIYNLAHPSLSTDANNYLYVVWSGQYSGSPTIWQLRCRKYTGSWGSIEDLTSATVDQKLPILIWGLYPEIGGDKINRPKTGFAFVWNDGSIIQFYKSSDLTWEGGGNQPPTDGLVGYWSFDEGAGSTAHDGSGNGNDGTIYSATWTTDTPNGTGYALSFDGVDDYVEISDVSDFVFNDESVTFSAWVQIVDNINEYRTFIFLGDADFFDYHPYFFMGKSRTGFIDGRLFMSVVPVDNGGYIAVSDQDGDTLPKNTWIHLVGVVDYENLLILLYINGNLEDSAPLGSYDLGAANQLKLRFGMTSFTTSDLQHKGLLDEVRIYNRALSEDEIQYLYNTPGGNILISEIALGDLEGWDGQRKLVRTSDGVFHCVYQRSDGQHSQIYHSYSNDDGDTWTEESVTSEDYDQVSPDITVDSNDNMHVVWQGCHDNSPSYSQIRYRKYDGNWLQIENITSDYNWDHRSPAIGVDGNDNLHVVFQKVDYIGGSWCQHGCGPAFYTNNIQGFWRNPEMIGEGPEYNDAVPSISIGPNNYLHVAWDAGGYHNANCWHSAYRRNNTNFWEPIKFFPCYDNGPSMAVDNQGNVHHVTKYSYPLSGIKYRMRDNVGWVIEEIIQNTVPAPVSKYPSIAIDSNEYIHVVWPDNGNIFYSKKTTSWSDIETIISDTDSTWPHLIWSWYPEVNGVRTNIPKNGFAFVWNDGSMIKFYKSADLEWEDSGSQPDTTPPGKINDLLSPDLSNTGYVYPTGKSPTKCPPRKYGYADGTAKQYYNHAGWLARGNDYYKDSTKYHIAVDIDGNKNDPVYAIDDGTVVYADRKGANWGYSIPGKDASTKEEALKDAKDPNYAFFVKHKTKDNKEFLALYAHVKPMISSLEISENSAKIFNDPIPLKQGQIYAKLDLVWYLYESEYHTPKYYWWPTETHLHYGVKTSIAVPPPGKWGAYYLTQTNWPNWEIKTTFPKVDNDFVDSIKWINKETPEDPISPDSKRLLIWTAPADDGYDLSSGLVTSYDIRYSTSIITESNWNSANQCIDEPTPSQPGNLEYYIVSGLSSQKKYYFGIKSIDDAGNPSKLSNIISKKTGGLKCILKCPADINIIDPEGFVINKTVNDIFGATYFETDINGDGDPDDIVNIPFQKMGDYTIIVIPEEDALPTDTYTLTIYSIYDTVILANNALISDIPNQPYYIRSNIGKITKLIESTIDIDPDTLNINSTGKWITCYIELPNGYNVSNISIDTILLNDLINVEITPINISDYDEDGIPDLMVKFDRQNVISILDYGDDVEIRITGELIDGTKFEGIDYIKVI